MPLEKTIDGFRKIPTGEKQFSLVRIEAVVRIDVDKAADTAKVHLPGVDGLLLAGAFAKSFVDEIDQKPKMMMGS